RVIVESRRTGLVAKVKTRLGPGSACNVPESAVHFLLNVRRRLVLITPPAAFELKHRWRPYGERRAARPVLGRLRGRGRCYLRHAGVVPGSSGLSEMTER